MVGCCKLLGVSSFVLEVRSKSGKAIPVNLHQTNVTLCSDKKGEVPKAPGVLVQHPVWVFPPVPRPG